MDLSLVAGTYGLALVALRNQFFNCNNAPPDSRTGRKAGFETRWVGGGRDDLFVGDFFEGRLSWA